MCIVSDMAGLICKNRVLMSQTLPMMTKLSSRSMGGHVGVPLPQTKVDIGKREVVGFGGNGEATYIDSVMAPFPAIRFVNSFHISIYFMTFLKQI